MGHPAIKEAGVCGVEDATWGQVPVAFIVLKKDVSPEEIKEYCFQHLAKYKVPKEVYVVDALPRNASNKLLRRKLKELLP